MATIDPVYTALPESGNPIAWIVQWGPMANGDVGESIGLWAYADRSIQVQGTFGSGGTVALEGSNDGANFHALSNPAGTALNVLASALNSIVELPVEFRPRVSAGDGTTALTVTMFLRRTTPGF